MVALLQCGSAAAQKPSADGGAWTGLTHPEDVIEARESLMMAVERLMEPIDSLEVESENPAEITAAAARVSQIMLALPHLFPPTTNLYDPAAATPKTLALPAIWASFPTFYRMAGATAAAAKKLSETRDAQRQVEAAEALRDTCDACHAVYLRPYVPSKVTEKDLDFDFDSVFRKR